MFDQPPYSHPIYGMDPSICALCPPDRVCAWACCQGAGAVDVIIEMALIEDRVLAPSRIEEESSKAPYWPLLEAYC